MDADKIREVVRQVRAQPAHRREAWCRERYPDFALAFPTLLRAVVERPDDLCFLDMMLQQREALSSGGASVDDVDRHVYDALRERYVTPVLDRKDPNRKA